MLGGRTLVELLTSQIPPCPILDICLLCKKEFVLFLFST